MKSSKSIQNLAITCFAAYNGMSSSPITSHISITKVRTEVATLGDCTVSIASREMLVDARSPGAALLYVGPETPVLPAVIATRH